MRSPTQTTSKRPSDGSACGAIIIPPPKKRPFAMAHVERRALRTRVCAVDLHADARRSCSRPSRGASPTKNDALPPSHLGAVVHERVDLPADAEARDVHERAHARLPRRVGSRRRMPRSTGRRAPLPDAADRLVERAREAERPLEVAARAARDEREVRARAPASPSGVDVRLHDLVQRCRPRRRPRRRPTPSARAARASSVAWPRPRVRTISCAQLVAPERSRSICRHLRGERLPGRCSGFRITRTRGSPSMAHVAMGHILARRSR